MKKKSWSWSASGSRWGGRPWLISWAAVVIIERAAWRKIWLSRTTGAAAGGDQVLERLAGPDRRQLVGVADEDEVGRLGEAGEQHLGQAQVQHRGLVDDHQVDRQRVARPEGRLAARHPLQQAVDRLRLVAGRFLEPAGGATGRGAEGDRRVRRFGLGDDLPGADGLADAGAAGEDRDARVAKAPRTAAHCSSVRFSRGVSPGSWTRWGGASVRARSVAATATSLAWVSSR